MMKAPDKETSEQVPSLRPPTLMIDLLFGALMLFAFQMGAPTAKTVIPHDVDLPTAGEVTDKEPAQLLPLKPVRKVGGNWHYALSDGQVLPPEEMVRYIKKSGKTPVLIISKAARVQDYVDAEQPLRQAGMKVGLAVELDQGEIQ